MSPTRLSADTCPCAATNSGVPSSTKDVYVAAASLGGVAISKPTVDTACFCVGTASKLATSVNNSPSSTALSILVTVVPVGSAGGAVKISDC